VIATANYPEVTGPKGQGMQTCALTLRDIGVELPTKQQNPNQVKVGQMKIE